MEDEKRQYENKLSRPDDILNRQADFDHGRTTLYLVMTQFISFCLVFVCSTQFSSRHLDFYIAKACKKSS